MVDLVAVGSRIKSLENELENKAALVAQIREKNAEIKQESDASRKTVLKLESQFDAEVTKQKKLKARFEQQLGQLKNDYAEQVDVVTRLRRQLARLRKKDAAQDDLILELKKKLTSLGGERDRQLKLYQELKMKLKEIDALAEERGKLIDSYKSQLDKALEARLVVLSGSDLGKSEFLGDSGRVKALWVSGDWEELIRLDNTSLSNLDGREVIALYVAVAYQQVENYEGMHRCIEAANNWGASEDDVKKLLGSSLHNTLAITEVLVGGLESAANNFRLALMHDNEVPTLENIKLRVEQQLKYIDGVDSGSLLSKILEYYTDI